MWQCENSNLCNLNPRSSKVYHPLLNTSFLTYFISKILMSFKNTILESYIFVNIIVMWREWHQYHNLDWHDRKIIISFTRIYTTTHDRLMEGMESGRDEWSKIQIILVIIMLINDQSPPSHFNRPLCENLLKRFLIGVSILYVKSEHWAICAQRSNMLKTTVKIFKQLYYS